MLNKKAQAELAIIVIIILILVFLGWLINLGSRECNKNSDCGEGFYCGVDHGCHKIPIIEKSTTIIQRDYTKPAMILGGAIVIASIFFNFDKIKPRRKPEGPNVYY